MPHLSNNTLDDPIQTESIPSFAGGQRSYSSPDRLANTESAALLNVDIRDGTATTRRGTASVGTTLSGAILALAWYDTPDAEYLVACTSGALHQWDGSAWTLLASYEPAASGLPLALAQLNDCLYLADGATPLMRWNGAALEELGAGAEGNPPLGSLLITAGQRLWMAGVSTAPDTLVASQPLEGGSSGWDAALGALRIGAGEGDPITGLAEWEENQLVVFKRNSIHIVRADPAKTSGEDETKSLANAVVTKISGSTGCVAHRSIARVGSDVWFLSPTGVQSVSRVLSSTQSEVREALSWPVHDVVEQIHWPAAHLAVAIYWDHRYLLSVPLQGAPSPETVLVFHTQRQAWSGLWTGWKATAWAVSQANGHERLHFGRADGHVRRWLQDVARASETESTYQDAGAHVPTQVATRALTFGDPFCEKSGLSVQVEFFQSQASAQVAVRLDEDEPISLAQTVATGKGALVLPLQLDAQLTGTGVIRKAFGLQGLPPFRTLQAVIRSPAGKLSVRGVAASGFVDTVRLEE